MDAGRKATDKRKFHNRIPIGTVVAIRTNNGLVKGKVTSHDNGNWHYVGWEPKTIDGKPHGVINGYLTSQQFAVYTEEKHAA